MLFDVICVLTQFATYFNFVFSSCPGLAITYADKTTNTLILKRAFETGLAKSSELGLAREARRGLIESNADMERSDDT